MVSKHYINVIAF